MVDKTLPKLKNPPSILSLPRVDELFITLQQSSDSSDCGVTWVMFVVRTPAGPTFMIGMAGDKPTNQLLTDACQMGPTDSQELVPSPSPRCQTASLSWKIELLKSCGLHDSAEPLASLTVNMEFHLKLAELNLGQVLRTGTSVYFLNLHLQLVLIVSPC